MGAQTLFTSHTLLSLSVLAHTTTTSKGGLFFLSLYLSALYVYTLPRQSVAPMRAFEA